MAQALQMQEKPEQAMNNNYQAAGLCPFYHKVFEKLFQNLPECNCLEEDEHLLPAAWALNYTGLFNDMKTFFRNEKRGKQKKQVKRPWNNVNLNKLIKRYDELAASIEEFKETDSEADKLAVIATKNFVARIQRHLKDLHHMALLLNVFSFAPLTDAPLSESRA